VVVAVAAGSLALVVSGCQRFFGPAFDGNFPSPSPIASYSSGTASIAIASGETIKLDNVAAGAGVDSMFGSNVRWSSSSGWNLRVTGAGASQGFGDGIGFGSGSAYLTLDRIADGQHWTTFDPSRCIVDVKVADAKELRGTANLQGRRVVQRARLAVHHDHGTQAARPNEVRR
jgi:hypothetical protein